MVMRDTSSDQHHAGWLVEARPSDQLLVVALRRWLDGPDGQQAVRTGLSGQIGAAKTRSLLDAFEAFLYALAEGLSRRLTRHTALCPSIGQDERLLTEIVRAAGEGDYETAHAHAQGVVRAADRAIVLERAAHLGSLLDEMGLEPVSGAEARARLH